ncbi:MAG: tetratricopeptide repeat protein [Lysobacterales bacterium]|jgi:tetratricopeptide (TPR) repeat protein
MNRNARFWTLAAVFQVVFGLAVFGLTRQYYIDRPTAPAPGAAAIPHSQLSWPKNGAAGGEESELQDLITSFGDHAVVQDPNEIVRRADEFFEEGEYDRAAGLYRQLIDSGFRDVNTYNNLGITLQYLGRTGEALKVLNEGIAVDSSYQRIWLTLGFVSAQAGKLDDARVALQTAVDLDADNEVGKSAAHMLENLP